MLDDHGKELGLIPAIIIAGIGTSIIILGIKELFCLITSLIF